MLSFVVCVFGLSMVLGLVMERLARQLAVDPKHDVTLTSGLKTILRVDQFGACCRGKAYRPHLRATLFEFGLKGFPRHALAAVVIERRQAAF